MFINSIRTNNINHRNSNYYKSKISCPQFCAKGIYLGSFDPITNGQLDIINRAAKLFNELTILIATNPEKKSFSHCLKG